MPIMRQVIIKKIKQRKQTAASITSPAPSRRMRLQLFVEAVRSMLESVFLQIACFASLSIGLRSPEDARQKFASTFYREYVQRYELSETNFVCSPSGIQKFLAVIYAGLDDELAADFLADLRLPASVQPMQRANVLDYFSNDFNEQHNEIQTRNFLLAPSRCRFFDNFTRFAMDYFGVCATSIKQAERSVLNSEFGDVSLAFDALHMLSSLELHTQLKHNFQEFNKTLVTTGLFRYAELSSRTNRRLKVKVLEVPLEAPTPHTLLLFQSKLKSTFAEFLSELLDHGDDLATYSELLEHHFRHRIVKVRLPRFHIKSQLNAASFFIEFSLQRTLRIFSNPQELPNMLQSVPEHGVMLGSLWQKATVHLISDSWREHNRTHANGTKVFDATEKPFLFIVKSNDVVYFIGHHTT